MRLVLTAFSSLLPTAPARAESVDLELVFAADGSGSIDDDELRLQRQGWADALTSPEVLARHPGRRPWRDRGRLHGMGRAGAPRCSSSTGT